MVYKKCLLKKIGAVAGVVCALFVFSATAQADNSVPEQAQKELTSQAKSFREETRHLSLPVEEKQPKIEVKKEKEEEISDKGPFFFIKKIKITGNTVFKESVFQEYVSQFENRKVSFGRLKQLSQLITNYYRSRGYSTSRAYVPPQKINDGFVTINVLEGKIGNVFVEGNKYFPKKSYENEILFQDDKIFRYQDFEEALYFINRKPDRYAQSYLLPGNEAGASDILLKTKEQYPVHPSYEFNNHGTKLTYRARHLAHLNNNSLTGHDDAMNLTYSGAEEGAFDAGSMSYNVPITRKTSLQLETDYVQTLLVRDLAHFEIKGKSFNFSPGITHSFVRTLKFSLDGYAGLEIKDSKTILDSLKTNFDRLRIIKFGPRATFQDAGGRLILSGDVHWGIAGFLGSLSRNDPASSRVNAGGDFLYYTASIARVQQLPYSAYVILRANGQWSPDNLTAPEQFRLGGAYSVRGYPESDSAGDRGFGFSAEGHVPPFFLPPKWTVPFTKKKWRDTLELIGFLDGGKAFFREKAQLTSVKDRFLLGTGFGVRLNLEEFFSLTLDFGFPIGDDSTDQPNKMQTHLSLLHNF